jgi:hypothetical protein
VWRIVSTIVDVKMTSPDGVEAGIGLELVGAAPRADALDTELLELELAKELVVELDATTDVLLGVPDVAAGAGCVFDPTKGKLVV